MKFSKPRPSRLILHMRTALMWAERSICKRIGNGALITDESMREICSFGYNGPARGLPADVCTGEKGQCQCLHAEANALFRLRSKERNLRLFCTSSPCYMCAQAIIQSDITRVYYHTQYRRHEGLYLLKSRGIQLIKLDEDGQEIGFTEA